MSNENKRYTDDEMLTLGEMLRRMIELSGESARKISRDIGRSDGFIGQMLYRGSVPGIDLLSEIANACGFRLYAIGHGVQFNLNGAAGDSFNFAPLIDDVGEPVSDEEFSRYFETLSNEDITALYGVAAGESISSDALGASLADEIEQHIQALQSCVDRLRRGE